MTTYLPKSWRTTRELIASLESKGMVFSDLTFASKCLEQIGYYRLSSYWYPFYQTSRIRSGQRDKANFVKEIDFQEVYELYCFDEKLRSFIYESCGVLEIALKSLVINKCTEKEGDWFWYRDPLNFNKSHWHASNLRGLEEDWRRSEDPFVEAHYDKYGEAASVPAYKILQTASFGTIAKMFSNLKNDYQPKLDIAHEFGFTKPKELGAVFKTLVVIRNIAAHHGIIWNRSIQSIPPVLKKSDVERFSKKWIGEFASKELREHLYYNAALIIYLLGGVAIDPSHWKSKFIDIISSRPKTVTLQNLRFPEQWEQDSFWK